MQQESEFSALGNLTTDSIAEKLGLLPQAMDGHHIELQKLHEVIGILEQRLIPVLTPDMTDNAKEPPEVQQEPIISGLTMTVRGATDQTVKANNRLNGLLKRLEV